LFLIALFNISQSADLQLIAKKLQFQPKKNKKNDRPYQKKYLTLHRFNEQMIVLQI